MKRKLNFVVGSIAIMLILLISTTVTPTFAADTLGKWVPKASMATARDYLKTEVVDGKIFVIGGRNNNEPLSSVEEYDPTSNIWTTKASMSTPRFNVQTELIDGKIYAIGGMNSSTILSTVEEYDPVSNTWTTKTPMTFARTNFQTVLVNGKIYAIGGRGTLGWLSSLEEYDPATNKWTTKTSMSTRRDEFQAEVVGGKIYVIGGCEGQSFSSVEEYDPATDKWTTKASMSDARNWFQTEVIDGRIYAIGGTPDSGSTNLSSVEEYDPISNTWIARASMSVKRHNFYTELINGKIYAMSSGMVEEYDPIINTWTTKASMPDVIGCSGTEVIDGKIYALCCDGVSDVLYLEVYTVSQPDPTLTLTASSKNVKVCQQFTTSVDIHNVTNICAEDIVINYDKELFTYSGVEAQAGLKIYKKSAPEPGTVRFICACQGKENAATGDKGLITLKFTAKKEGTGKVDIVKGRIADNATLEMDVAEANCGEDTITVEGYADVNRTGEFTLLDLGIDGWYNGMNAADTDTARFNADVIADGKIDDNDLAEITKGILANSNYPFNKVSSNNDKT